MRHIFAIAIFALASTAAADCVDSQGNDILNQPEIFQPMIEKAGSCYEARELAEACAWGSSLDVSTAGAAYAVCENELNAQGPSTQLTSLLGMMNATCDSKYANEQGTMYRSFNAYCRLSAIGWIFNLATPN